MHIDQRKEQFSLAYAHAIAAVAGYRVANWNVDDDSVDLTMGAKRGTAATYTAPRLDIQMKCTHVANFADGHLRYSLKVKNYDDLVDPNVLVPRILVVMVVPEDLAQWCSQTAAEMILRRCGYWVSLAGGPATDNQEAVTVYLPEAHLFTAAALGTMMQTISQTGRL